jgi:hypothetical protein
VEKYKNNQKQVDIILLANFSLIFSIVRRRRHELLVIRVNEPLAFLALLPLPQQAGLVALERRLQFVLESAHRIDSALNLFLV